MKEKKKTCQYHRIHLPSTKPFNKCNRKVEGLYKAKVKSNDGEGPIIRTPGSGIPVCNLHLFQLRQLEAEEAGWYKIDVD